MSGTRHAFAYGMAARLLKSDLPIAEAFKAEYLEYYRMLPLSLCEGVLTVAVAGEPNRDALVDLEVSYSARLDLVPVEIEDLLEAIRAAFDASESMVELIRDLDVAVGTISLTDEPLTDLRDLANQPPVIRFVNLLIRDAHEARASDIHLEATRDGMRVRFRIDGVLSELPGPPRSIQAAIVSRIKLLAELDIAERRQPQDGRIRVRLEHRELDLRISTVPTLFGESVVLRLLDHGTEGTSLSQLGMSAEVLERFRRAASRAHGIVLATGPTGSGKTTTLYAALGLRDPSTEKVITVEDPVEYHLGGITQVPVHSKAGVTFAAALRSILRQDPDVLMVGEMRDAETAGIAVQAAMTGHLVLSTLHTNDAVSAIARLTDLQVEPYMVAATVEAVLAQRLVRRICPDCQERYRPDAGVVAMIARQPVGELTLTRGAGCDGCRHTGFRGRIGIFELFEINDEVKQAMSRGADSVTLRALGAQAGMVTLRADGWQKVQAGLTTVEEVLRVAGE